MNPHTRASDSNLHNNDLWAVRQSIEDCTNRLPECNTHKERFDLQWQIESLQRIIAHIEDIPRRRLLLRQCIIECSQKVYELLKSL